MKYTKAKFYLTLSVLIIIGLLYFINSIIGNNKYKDLKNLFSFEQKKIIKKYIFPYKYIDQLEKNVDDLSYASRE